MVDTTKYLRKCRNPQIERTIKRILEDLSRYRISITTDHNAARYLARNLREQRDQKWIYFSWNSRWNESVIHLSPSIRMETDGRRVKLHIDNIPKRIDAEDEKR